MKESNTTSNSMLAIGKHLAKRSILLIGLLMGATVSSQTTWNMVPGWNLLGNNSIGPLDVTYAGLGNPDQTNSIWTWNATTRKWSFYAPLLSNVDLAAYAQSKGYDVISSIASKQGFWVNAATAFSVTFPWKNNAVLAESDFKIGWNLVGGAGTTTPSQLNQSLQASLNSSGQDITTMWAWDSASSTWKLFAPSLEAQGGSALSDYISTHGYKPFATSFTNSEGVWVYTSQITPIDPCAVPKHQYGDITYPDSYKGSYAIPIPNKRLAPNVIRGMDFKDLYPGWDIDNRLTDTGCTDSTLYAKNSYVETLDRMKAVGSERIWIYNFGTWDDFTKSNFSVDPKTYHIPIDVFTFVVDEAKKRNMKVFYTWQFNDFDTKGNFYTHNPNASEFEKIMDAYRRESTIQAALAERLGIDGISADPNIFMSMDATPFYKSEWISAVTSVIGDIRKVYRGQIVYGNPVILDEVLIKKIDALVIPSWGWEIPYKGITKFSLEVLKSHYHSGLTDNKQRYDIATKGVRPNVPVIWNIQQKSAADFYAIGMPFIEDAICILNCVQLTYGTDFSLHALGIEAALEVINEQTSFNTDAVKFNNGFWHADKLTPSQFKYLGWAPSQSAEQWSFPNLADSIRNKPAEGIVKYWFGR